MSFVVEVDAARWRAHLTRYAEQVPGLVPVVKGDGYGFGIALAAAEAHRVGARTVAVGLAEEVPAAAAAFAGDVLVLGPLRPFDPPVPAELAGRVVRTVDSTAALEQLQGTGTPVLLEVGTAMRRHGVAPGDLGTLAAAVGDLPVRGVSLHLPIDRRGGYDPVAEVEACLTAAAAAATAGGLPWWVSHLSPAEMDGLRERHPGLELRARVGTSFWLGDPGAVRARATVLDVHGLRRGDRAGYRQRAAATGGHLVVVSGGTVHGVGLAAPRSLRAPLDRAKTLATGGLEAAGVLRSPFRWQGRRLRFLEPPHMQVSMLVLGGSVAAPSMGDRLDVDIRITTTRADRVELT